MGAISTEIVRLNQDPDEERTTEDIRQEISQHRSAISKTINRLDDRFQEAVDWRTYVSDHPLVALGLAAGAGLLLAGIFKPRPSPRERLMDALADGVQDLSGQLRDGVENMLNPATERNRPAFKGAVTALATTAATNYLKRKLSEQFSSPESFRNESRHE